MTAALTMIACLHRAGAHKSRARCSAARRVVFETRSSLSGRIRVVERGRERRLMIGGAIQSVYFPDGDWSAAEPEYWARALAPARVLRPEPRILLVGLGGGTQVHLLKRYATPRLVTVIERDPIVIGVANEWFGLKSVGGLEILCADAERALRQLTLSRRRFDFIMDDISYEAPIDEAVRAARTLAWLLAPRGVLVLNQHRRPAAQALGEAVSDRLSSIRLERVRQGAENVLVIAARDGTPPRRACGMLEDRPGRSQRPKFKAARKRRPESPVGKSPSSAGFAGATRFGGRLGGGRRGPLRWSSG